MSYYSTYRWCAVAVCKNTSIKTPGKLWIQLPSDLNMRKTWLKLARRDPDLLSEKSRLYICEDHFDLEHDMENYVKYKVMGSVKRIKMKPHCIPSRFDWNTRHESLSKDSAHYHMKAENVEALQSCSEGLPGAAKMDADGTYDTEVHVKHETQSDSDGNDPMSSIGAEQCKIPKTEPEEAYIEAGSPHSVDVSKVGDVKCEYESDPEYDDELRRISLEQRQRVETDPADKCIKKDGVQRADSKKRKQAAETASEQQTHQTREDATTASADTRHQCTVCRKFFSRPGNLRTHLRLHTGEKPYACNICQRRFARNSCLRKHSQTHTGEKPFKCDYCHYRSSKKSNLQSHLRTHTAEKPFECNVCYRRFSHKHNLESHSRIHTAEKPFECNICQSRFTRKYYLRTHLKTHTGEKPFECHVCQHRCAQRSNLRSHLLSHAAEKPHKCHICHKHFADKHYLKTIHLKKHNSRETVWT